MAEDGQPGFYRYYVQDLFGCSSNVEMGDFVCC